MASEKEQVSLGKFLSLVLRHQPQLIGLTLDAHGWVSVDELLAKAQAFGKRIDRATLDQVVANNNKQRYSYSPDGLSIRANQGHSVQVDLQLQAQWPPEVLYHGTASAFVADIQAQGLQRRSRQHVHLSADIATAVAVGSRHGQPRVFELRAAAMAADGYVFYRSANGVWLTEFVPAQYLSLLHST